MLWACTDEEWIDDAAIVGGESATLDLQMQVAKGDSLEITSRAVDLSNQVSDLYLFIFDEKQRLKSKYYFAKDRLKSDARYSTNGDAQLERSVNNRGMGTISRLKTTSGLSYIMGVANVNLKVGDEILDELQAVTSVNELKAVLAQESTVTPGIFTMSGYYSAQKNALSADGKVQIPAGRAQLNGWIHLVPLDAQIRFVVKNHEASRGTFTLKSWKVVNVPKRAYLFSMGKEPDAQTSGFYDSLETYDLSETSDGRSYGFSFCMQERWAKPKQRVTRYPDRAKWTAQVGGRKQFINAPDHASYVILKGHFMGKSLIVDENDPTKTTEEEVDADVTYFILLGHHSHVEVNDYTVRRHTVYTYTVSVKGLKDISVEVRSPEEPRADAEGTIILSGDGRKLDFDAHYEEAVLTFRRTEIQAAIREQRLGYAVITPYGNKIYRTGEKDDTEQAPFAEWVTFKKGARKIGNAYYPLAYTPNRLLSVREMLADLEQAATTGSEEVLYYSVYVNEYYYDKEPGTNAPASWKDFVNADERKLFVLAKTEESQDKQSTLTSAARVLSQKSIHTIYDKEAAGLKRAWGLEVVEDDLFEGQKVLPRNGKLTSGTDRKYGRHNLVNALGTAINWGALIDERGYLKTQQDMIFACMQRNRDLNGNGRIEPQEVRWYLPSLYQYQQMYVGMYGINAVASRLYYTEAVTQRKWQYKHYLSSYKRQVLWAEEGLSNSPTSQSYASHFYIRCVRDLGVDLQATAWNDDTQFQDIFTYDPAKRSIEMTYLNKASVRMNLEAKEIHGDCTTFSEKNKPALRLQYSTELLPGRRFISENEKAERGLPTICEERLGTGWRLPTLTELNLLIQAAGEQTIGKDVAGMVLLTRTKFEFWEWNMLTVNDGRIPSASLVQTTSWLDWRRYYSGRYAHSYLSSPSSIFRLSNGDSTGRDVAGYIRCVRDVAR